MVQATDGSQGTIGIGYPPEKQASHQLGINFAAAAFISSRGRYARESAPHMILSSSRLLCEAGSSWRVGMSIPYMHGYFTGGEAMRRWTSDAPAERSFWTITGAVVARTSESSTMTTLLPLTRRGVAEFFRLADSSRDSDPGRMNDLPRTEYQFFISILGR